jgi:4-hydroxybenzoyl-CoA thioesterase
MARFERALRIRFSHCDPAGIVFYPQYFVLFNGLVEDWVNESLGLDYAALLGPRRTGLPTVQLETEFRAISRHGDLVTLGLELLRIGRRSFTLQLDCRAGEQLRVLARQTLVSTDLDSHRAVTLPTDLLAAMTQFQNGAPHA